MRQLYAAFVSRLGAVMIIVSGIALMGMAGLTLMDVVLRYLGRPILGTYELVGYLSAAIIGLALPRASLNNSHVTVGVVLEKLPSTWSRIFRIFTRILVLLMFFFAIYYFTSMAKNLIDSNTVSSSLKIPFYPVIFVLAFSCFVQCLVCILQILEGKGEQQ
jgi:TRAP-type C4-dicarboxylate transport system permease small subunit